MDENFDELTAPLRAELLAHCYRLTGSVADAEDRVQETYLKAWQAFHGFEGRSSVRTWMYRIATNTCLTSLTAASRRVLPSGLGRPPGNPTEPIQERDDVSWLEPLPDNVLWGSTPPSPEDSAIAREGFGLAYVAAVQQLPPKQRAVLVLRDVLGFSAAETAELLETTPASVNSAMQRARESLNETSPQPTELSAEDRAVVDRFITAFESHQLDELTDVLTADVVWQMPPFDRWYSGSDAAIALAATQCPAKEAGDLRLLPSAVNGGAGAGMYLRDPDGVYRPFQYLALEFRDGRIGSVTGFFDDQLFHAAGLPEVLT